MDGRPPSGITTAHQPRRTSYRWRGLQQLPTLCHLLQNAPRTRPTRIYLIPALNHPSNLQLMHPQRQIQDHRRHLLLSVHQNPKRGLHPLRHMGPQDGLDRHRHPLNLRLGTNSRPHHGPTTKTPRTGNCQKIPSTSPFFYPTNQPTTESTDSQLPSQVHPHRTPTA